MILEENRLNSFFKYALITSRPGIKNKPLNCFELEMIGFGELEKEKYIENYFDEKQNKIEILKKVLKKNTNLNSSVSIPLYLEMVCMMSYVEKGDGGVFNEKTKTGEIYQNIIDQILEINISKEKFPTIKHSYMGDIEKLIFLMKNLILAISFYSFENKIFFIPIKLVKTLSRSFLQSPNNFDVTTFNYEESSQLSSSSLSLSLQNFSISDNTVFGVDDSFEIISKCGLFRVVGEYIHFIHFSIHEFLASLFISHNILHNQQKNSKYIIEYLEKENQNFIETSTLPIFLSFHFRNYNNSSFNILEILFKQYLNHKFYFNYKLKSICKKIGECFNEMEGKESNPLILEFLENFKKNKEKWKHNLLFQFSSNLSLIKYFLQNKKLNKNIEDADFLHLACENENISNEVIEYLLENKSDVNKKCNNAYPIHFLLGNPNNNCSLESLKLLMDNKADLNVVDDFKVSPFGRAVHFRYPIKILECLINSKSDINHRDKNGSTPLHSACFVNNHFFKSEEKSLEIIKFLIVNKSDLNITLKSINVGDTPFEVLFHKNNKKHLLSEVIKFMLEKKIDLRDDNKTEIESVSLFKYLTAYQSITYQMIQTFLKSKSFEDLNKNVKNEKLNYFEKVEDLIKNKGDLNSIDNLVDSTPLHIASFCENISTNTLKYLIENKSEINSLDIFGETPLHSIFRSSCFNSPLTANLNFDGNSSLFKNNLETISSRNKNENVSIEKIKFLIENKSNINSQNKYGDTPLHLACRNENISIEKMKHLIENKSDINSENKTGSTPLHLACKNENISYEMIKLLLDNKANPNLKNNIYQTFPFLHACKNKRVSIEILRCMLENKADLNIGNDVGISSLSCVFIAQSNSFEITKYLIDNKANLNLPKDNGKKVDFQPIHTAVTKNVSLEIIKYMVENKANINEPDVSDKIPLYSSCKHNNEEVIKYLVEQKSDINHRSSKIIETATQYCTPQIVEYLKKNSSSICFHFLFFGCENQNCNRSHKIEECHLNQNDPHFLTEINNILLQQNKKICLHQFENKNCNRKENCRKSHSFFLEHLSETENNNFKNFRIISNNHNSLSFQSSNEQINPTDTLEIISNNHNSTPTNSLDEQSNPTPSARRIIKIIKSRNSEAKKNLCFHFLFFGCKNQNCNKSHKIEECHLNQNDPHFLTEINNILLQQNKKICLHQFENKNCNYKENCRKSHSFFLEHLSETENNNFKYFRKHKK